jgi:hypothetical protein
MTNAHGGCLGCRSRGRAWHATKRGGEARAAGEPPMPEWGNLRRGDPSGLREETRRGELKHLSTRTPKVTTRPVVAASELGKCPNGTAPHTAAGGGRPGLWTREARAGGARPGAGWVLGTR